MTSKLWTYFETLHFVDFLSSLLLICRYAVSLPENAGPQFLLNVTVTDADATALNSAKQVTLSNASSIISFASSTVVHTINFTEGSTFPIYILASTDFETERSVTFSVSAEDRSGLTATADVVVTITDVNDEPPVFSSAVYNRSVSEGASPGQAVASVSATDGDEPGTLAALVEYAIVSGNVDSAFALNRTVGELVLRTGVDREGVVSYTLNISATDSAPPYLAAFATVHIEVVDINDNDPVFNLSNATAQIAENLPAEQFVAAFAASDADSGLNGEVFFAITAGNPSPALFSINASTGVVTTIQPLDYEALTASDYNLTITVRDRGSPARSAIAWLAIYIIDVNDNAPVFSPLNLAAQVDRTQFADQLVVSSLPASDRDTAAAFGVVSFRFLSGNDANLFSLNTTTGRIVTRVGLCNISSGVITLRVEALDGGNPPLVALNPLTIDVTVSTSNDNNPAFPAEGYRQLLVETSVAGVVVENVSATDADCGDSDNLEYSIIGGLTTPPLFAINNTTGIVTLLAPFTRLENGANVTYRLDVIAAPYHFLTVQADDHGSPTSRTGVTILQIDVVDDNDNSPLFGQPTG